MTTKLGASLVLLACVLVARADENKKGTAQNPALERFKQLAGEWISKSEHDGKPQEMRVIYKVTSAGSAVIETIDPGTNHEMVTLIHSDGDELALTHYCALGNQPHMRARPKADDSKIAFEFVKATNLKSDKDMYMRSVTFTFVDKNHFKAEWTHFKDGKEAGKMTAELTRKK